MHDSSICKKEPWLFVKYWKEKFYIHIKKLDWSQSTISKEIKRNTHDSVYLVSTAENRSKKRKLNKYFFYLFKYQIFKFICEALKQASPWS